MLPLRMNSKDIFFIQLSELNRDLSYGLHLSLKGHKKYIFNN